MKVSHHLLVCFWVLIFVSGCADLQESPFPYSTDEGPVTVDEKVDGIALVAPRNPTSQSEISMIADVNAGWVQIIPYGFSRPGDPSVTYNPNTGWWGESEEGVRTTIAYARNAGMKILLKPHIWVSGQGWAGDYTLTDEADWQAWEANYQAYMMYFAELGEELRVDMLCIGTEYRNVVRDRPDYFGRLADSVRTAYTGPITYASNWDNYDKVEFWEKVDYIGIDAYFPLIPATTPSVDSLELAWEPLKEDFRELTEEVKRPILFTEYGYLSVDSAAWRAWELQENLQNRTVNLQAQVNGYQGLYNTFWDEPWFAGGFAWVWETNNATAGGSLDRDWTPQNKPALEVIRARYE